MLKIVFFWFGLVWFFVLIHTTKVSLNEAKIWATPKTNSLGPHGILADKASTTFGALTSFFPLYYFCNENIYMLISNIDIGSEYVKVFA